MDNVYYFTLPSGHYCFYQLVLNDRLNKFELVVNDTTIPELDKMDKAGKSYYLDPAGDSLVLEGTKLYF